jgi:hypothetical protein
LRFSKTFLDFGFLILHPMMGFENFTIVASRSAPGFSRSPHTACSSCDGRPFFSGKPCVAHDTLFLRRKVIMSNTAARYIRLWVVMCVAMLNLAAYLPVQADEKLPSYARQNQTNAEETLHGHIASIPGKFHLELQDKRGFVDTVELHQGTIINPTGLSLAPGMSVTILGYAHGSVFEANQIDTPYTASYNYVPDYIPYYDYGYPVGAYPAWGWGANTIYGPGFGGYGWYGGGYGLWNGNGAGNSTNNGNNGGSWHGGGLRRTL